MDSVEEGRAAGAAESWAVVVASADAQREWWVGRWGAVATVVGVATVAGVETVEAARVAAARVAVREVMAMAMATGLMAAVAEMPAAAQEAA